MSISTQLTELLGVQHPVMLAGMGGIAGKELVGAVGRAGGFATFGAAVSVSNDGPRSCARSCARSARGAAARPTASTCSCTAPRAA